MRTRALAVALGGTLSIAQARPVTAQNNACDRSCLEGLVDRFLDAFVKHDPSALPIAGNVKSTENGQRLKVGDGSWRSMVGKGTYRLAASSPCRAYRQLP